MEKDFVSYLTVTMAGQQNFGSIFDSLYLIQGCTIISHYARHYRTGCPLPHSNK